MNLGTLVLFVAVLLYPPPALAYIDPGSGSAIISAIFGFIVAVGLAIKTYSYKLKSLFVSLFSRKVPAESGDNGGTSPQQ